MQKDYIRQMINRYMTGQLQPSEQEELLKYIETGNNSLAEEVLHEMILENAATASPLSNDEDISLLQKILSVDKPPPSPAAKVRNLFWRRFAVAASLLLIAGFAVYRFVTTDTPRPSLTYTQPLINDAAPGSRGAFLILDNGQKILLDSQGHGVIATQGATTISIKDGRLVYDTGTGVQEIYYNTMSTPKGRHYQLVLPDGSQVWLNAASSITYPTAFSDNERKVSITGEAYFEIAKDKTRPFRVSVNNQTEVEVLGTHFNINAYGDEGNIHTTLLEGAVKVFSNGKQATLAPGQQAVSGTTLSIVNNADIIQVMAWKNGLFNFNNTDIRLVLKQLERWYDVEVIIAGELKPKLIYGKMQSDLYLSQVLEILKKLGVNCRLEGKKLMTTP